MNESPPPDVGTTAAGGASGNPHGNPEGDNDVDEFAGLAPATRRSPVMALTIIGLAAVTAFSLRADLRYAISPRAAVALETLRGSGEPYLDRYVVVRGIPDRRNSLFVEARGAKSRESFFRLLDAEPPIFVRAADTSGRSDLSAAWRGRLRRFGDVAYAASLRDYFARSAATRRYLDLTSWKASLATGGSALRDRADRAVTLPADAVLVVESRPSEYALELPREKYPGQADAQHELERVLAPLGVKVRALEASPDSFRFATPALADVARRNALFAALEGAEIDFAPEVPLEKAPRASVRLADAGTLLVGRAKVAWADVTSVSFEEPLRVEDDALVLTEGEAPAGFLWAPLVTGLLFVLALFNAWYLFRPRRA